MSSISLMSLYLASALTFMAALLHFICVFWGAEGFRFLGAGNSIVRMAEKGDWYPNFMAISVGCILCIFSFYAFCAASGFISLPFEKIIISLVAMIFILRGLAFPWLKSRFSGNSHLFWYVSSFICLLLGSLYAIGAYSL